MSFSAIDLFVAIYALVLRGKLHDLNTLAINSYYAWQGLPACFFLALTTKKVNASV